MNLSVLLVASMLFVTYMTVRILHSYLSKKEEKYTKVEQK